MMSNDPTKQPGNDAQSINHTLTEWHDLLLRDKTSSTLDTIVRSDVESSTFPWKLHALLETAAKEGFEHIVSWLDNNASFKVHEPDLFVKQIMPRFFKRQSKYKSFQRQLNIWQFERLIGSKGSGSAGYFHVFFYRHDTSLFHLIKRSPLSQKLPFSLQQTSSHCSLDNEHDDHFQSFVEQPLPCPRKNSLTTMEPWKPESCDTLQTSCALLLEPNVNTDMMDSYGACSSVPNDDVLQVSIHNDSLNLDTSKPQYPNVVARDFVSLTSMSGAIPTSWEPWEEDNEFTYGSSLLPSSCWGDQQVLPSLEKNPDLHVASQLDHDLDRDNTLLRCNNEDGNVAKGRTRVLSAEEWKYVLLGMKIAMNAG